MGNQTEGMGLKLLKFHAIMHMAKDIINFGVPMEFDIGANESGHKDTKKAALLTQKNQETFNKQTADCLDKTDMLALAEQELNAHPLWNCGCITTEQVEPDEDLLHSTILGSKCAILVCSVTQELVMNANSGIEGEHIIEETFASFVHNSQNVLKPWISKIEILTELRQNDTIFVHVHHVKKVWRDWAIIDWGSDGHLPCELWGFVDLLSLPNDTGVNYGSCDLQPGVHAIIKCGL